MNYLAHLFLAQGPPEALAGNLLADFVKGSCLERLSPPMRQGVTLHRRIDAFTDRHPAVLRSRKRLPARWSRVSGVLTDVYFDHLLARDWADYSPLTLRQFLDRSYLALRSCMDAIPGELREGAQRLVEHDLLFQYARLDGVEWALRRMSRRLRAGSFCLEQAIPELLSRDEELAGDFRLFFPELQGHVRSLTEAKEAGGT